MKTPVAVQLLLPGMGGIAGFYEARTDRVLCGRCAGTPAPAAAPIPEADCGDLHCSRCRRPLRGVGAVCVARPRRLCTLPRPQEGAESRSKGALTRWKQATTRT